MICNRKTDALVRLGRAADALERELRRQQQSQPLLFKTSRELEIELERYLKRLSAMEACGASVESSELAKECRVMMECVTLLLCE